MIKGDPKTLAHDVVRFSKHISAWFSWRAYPSATSTNDAANHEAKARELLQKAKHHEMTAEECEQQRQSFARANKATGDPRFD